MKWQGKGVSEGLAMAQIHLFTPKLPEISRQPAADAAGGCGGGAARAL